MQEQAAIVVGAGIVGLAVAYHLHQDGLDVTVVDRDPVGDKASLGNAAGIAVTEIVPASVPGLIWKVPRWLLDPLGPLAIRPSHLFQVVPWFWRFMRAGSRNEAQRIGLALSALNQRVYDDLLPMLTAIGCGTEIHHKGALTVYETAAGFEADAQEWSFKKANGVDVQFLSGAEARSLEPDLSDIVVRGVFTPQWSHVNDPKLIVDRLREWLQTECSVRVVKGEVLILQNEGARATAILRDGQRFEADYVVVAAGAWSGELARQFGDSVLLESERGYNTTLPAPGVALTREVIFAERKFVATPLSIGLRVGGAAEFGGLNAVANYRRSEALAKLASRYLPALRTEGGTVWAGHRPATPDSLPVIGASPRSRNILYAFGHGHLGLTQAATTGRLIADLVAGRNPAIDLTPYAISRF